MNKYVMYAISTLFLAQTASVHAIDLATIKKTTYASIVAFIGYQFLTKKSLSEEELSELKSIFDEESTIIFLWRIVNEGIIGQKEKNSKLTGFDPLTGKALYDTYPATGIIGNLYNIHGSWFASFIALGITLQQQKEKLYEGLQWYTSRIFNKCL